MSSVMVMVMVVIMALFVSNIVAYPIKIDIPEQEMIENTWTSCGKSGDHYHITSIEATVPKKKGSRSP